MSKHTPPTWDEGVANAHLMAAAPRLLEALEELAKAVNESVSGMERSEADVKHNG